MGVGAEAGLLTVEGLGTAGYGLASWASAYGWREDISAPLFLATSHMTAVLLAGFFAAHMGRGCNRLCGLLTATLGAVLAAVLLAVVTGELLKAEALLAQADALRSLRVRAAMTACLRDQGLQLAPFKVVECPMRSGLVDAEELFKQRFVIASYACLAVTGLFALSVTCLSIIRTLRKAREATTLDALRIAHDKSIY